MPMTLEKDGKVFDTMYYESGTLIGDTFVKKGTADNQFKAIDGASDVPIGVLPAENITDKTDIPVGIIVAGCAKVLVGTGGVTKGSMVMLVDNLGKIVDATPTYGTEYIVGRALETAAAGSLAWIQIYPILP